MDNLSGKGTHGSWRDDSCEQGVWQWAEEEGPGPHKTWLLSCKPPGTGLLERHCMHFPNNSFNAVFNSGMYRNMSCYDIMAKTYESGSPIQCLFLPWGCGWGLRKATQPSLLTLIFLTYHQVA